MTTKNHQFNPFNNKNKWLHKYFSIKEKEFETDDDQDVSHIIKGITPLIVMLICLATAAILTIRALDLSKQDALASKLIVDFEGAAATYQIDGSAYDESGNKTVKAISDADTKVSYNYNYLSNQAPEASAFLRIDGTDISYPVMWSETDGYYLTHASDGTSNRNGAIYLATANTPDFSDPINYIFGHNMKSGLMFRHLNDFLDADYMNNHKDCYIVTDDSTRHYTLFFAESVSADMEMTVFNAACLGTELYTNYIRDFSQRTGYYISDSTELIVLITCTTSNRRNRTIVYGYLD